MMVLRLSFVLCVVSLFIAGFVYYPKWKQSGTEATLSWDASGYYMYLPAIFIYKDLKQCRFKDDILKRYGPTPDFQQAYLHPSGNYVMKYSIGQAIQFLPAFLISHTYASLSENYPDDGFSRPYQLGISIHSFLIAVLGIFVLMKVLRRYFSPRGVGLTLVCIVLGSNYLDYAGINGAMSHNGLFTIYALLLLVTDNYYRSPSLQKALAIGALIGMAALTRPTEIIAAVIPILWGVNVLSSKSIKERFSFFIKYRNHLVLAISLIGLIGFIQLLYWYNVTGEWIVYSYQDQGFSWLHPHFWEGIFSYKSGWITYSPIFLLIIPGFSALWQKDNANLSALFLFFCVFLYIAFAWDIWWYGGSLGQRAMVQCYPVLAFPIAASLDGMKNKKWLAIAAGLFIYLCIGYNIWLTHHAHRGGLLHAGHMTKAYFWKVLGKNEKNESYLKLLDTDEAYEFNPAHASLLYIEDFESDTTSADCDLPPISGNKSICISGSVEFSPQIKVDIDPATQKWLHIEATFKCINKEWEVWKMAHFVTKFYRNGQEIKYRLIRVHRLLQDGEVQTIGYQTEVPRAADELGIYFWNAGGNKTLQVDDVKVYMVE